MKVFSLIAGSFILAVCAACSTNQEVVCDPAIEPTGLSQATFAARVGENRVHKLTVQRNLGFPDLPTRPRYVQNPIAGLWDSSHRSTSDSALNEFNERVLIWTYNDGGGELSYDRELRDLGLRVGKDGKLHEIGPDGRHPGDSDDGPKVGWDELHRRQFGH